MYQPGSFTDASAVLSSPEVFFFFFFEVVKDEKGKKRFTDNSTQIICIY